LIIVCTKTLPETETIFTIENAGRLSYSSSHMIIILIYTEILNVFIVVVLIIMVVVVVVLPRRIDRRNCNTKCPRTTIRIHRIGKTTQRTRV
jgi:hypothetical protein